MTLRELYAGIDGSYEQATAVLRVEKLIDKHIRKFPKVGVVDAVLAAGVEMDPTRMFETAHAMKGVCSNLGLTKLAAEASELSEEFRPGNPRRHSDAEVRAILKDIETLYQKTTEGIRKYEQN